jgi:Spondin_N
MFIKKSSLLKVAMASAMLTLLTGCPFDDDDDSPDVVVTPTPPAPVPEYSYDVQITNLTNAQPLSPVAIALHGDEMLWTIGKPASNALEVLAEGGDNSPFIAQESIIASASSEGAVMPGANSTISVTTTDSTATYITIATMLVNTNDAFSGLTGLNLSSFDVNDSKTWTLGVYDAGTEANSESMGTIPGPADGGTGYDATRDDLDLVTMHSGTVTMDDGLTNSVLTQAHRFDNPAMKVTITRTK